MKIAIIAAMREELGAVQRAAGQAEKFAVAGLRAWRCRAGGHDIVLVESGMGFVNAARAAKRVIDASHPEMILSAGFCGGISPALRVGDVVVAGGLAVVAEEHVEEMALDVPTVSQDFLARQAAGGRRVFGGLFCSTPAIVAKKRLALLLSADAPYPVVEMESGAIARVAAENGIPFAAIRSVSDPVDEELGFTLDEFCDSSLRIRPYRVVLTCLRRPRIIPQLARLARNSRVAAESLTTAVRDFLAQI